MPELPDITVYIEAIGQRCLHQTLERVRVASPFLLRTVDPPLSATEGKRVVALRRIGKRIAIGVEPDIWLVLHLMIAGRLHWRKAGVKLAGRNALAAFDFSSGSLVFTEAGSERRASLELARGEAGLASIDPGGLDVLSASIEEFAAALSAENHTLKRSLTSPHLFDGIGNAYSDEILHSARLSPLALTQKLQPHEVRRLYEATRETLNLWIERLRAEAGDKFPEGVTAFRKDMAAHGRYGQPCPVCGAKVRRIRYLTNEVNYCPRCQTGGRLLRDRGLSRLLGEDWPRMAAE
jgi:formamidopyrimidine-DNA glycosylase